MIEMIVQALWEIRQLALQSRQLILDFFQRIFSAVFPHNPSLGINHVWMQVGDFIILTIFLVLCVPIASYIINTICGSRYTV
ncbi:hypothetical protein J7L60_05810 [Candidatus Bathyarchaeota archaeon]|nr:hypothetical protein [Candidatus Bathyarchaeota archaeon]